MTQATICQFDFGDTVHLSITTATNATPPVPADPATLSLTVRDPAGAETTYTWAGDTIVRDGVGEFHVDITCAVTGTWVAVRTAAGNATDSARSVQWHVGPQLV